MAMNPTQQGQGGQYWAKPGRVIDQRTVELSNPSDAQQIAAAAVSVPGLKFATHQDPQGKTRVTLSITPEASSRIQEVQRLHARLTELSAGRF